MRAILIPTHLTLRIHIHQLLVQLYSLVWLSVSTTTPTQGLSCGISEADTSVKLSDVERKVGLIAIEDVQGQLVRDLCARGASQCGSQAVQCVAVMEGA